VATDTDTKQLLAELERALQTPLVPGELVRWSASVKKALDELLPALRETINEKHEKHFNEIVAQDEGMHAKVERMQQEDAAILQQLEQFKTQVENLQQSAEELEPEEQRLEESRQEMVDAGLKLVLRTRSQEVAVETWLSEALARDRGEVD